MKKNFLTPSAAAKALAAVLSVSLLVAVPVRVYQLYAMIESNTGFFSVRNFTIPLLYAVLVIGAAALALICFLPGKKPFGSECSFGKAACVFAVITAVTMVVDAGAQTTNLISSVSELMQSTTFSVVGIRTVSAIVNSGAGLLALQVIFALLSALYFTLFGVYSFMGSNEYSKFKVLALTPLAWSIVRLVLGFMSKINYRYVSDLFLELFMLCAMMFFFISFARVNSAVNVEGAGKKMYAFGLITVLLTLTVSLPRLIVVITGGGARLACDYPLRFCDLAIGVFTAFYLFSSLKGEKIQPAEEN